MASEPRHGESIDDLDALLAALPPEIVDAVHALDDKENLIEVVIDLVGSSRVDLQACKLEYSIVSPK